MITQSGKQEFEIANAGARRERAVHQRHVEGGVLAAHEARDPRPERVRQRQRQQQQRLLLGIASDDDEGRRLLAGADLVLPRGEQVEALVGRRDVVGCLENASGRFGRGEIRDDLDLCKSRQRRLRRPVFDHGGHGHRATCVVVEFCCSGSPELCKETSIKSKGNDTAPNRGDAAKDLFKSVSTTRS